MPRAAQRCPRRTVVSLHAAAPEERYDKVGVPRGAARAPPSQVKLSLQLVNNALQGLRLPAYRLHVQP